MPTASTSDWPGADYGDLEARSSAGAGVLPYYEAARAAALRRRHVRRRGERPGVRARRCRSQATVRRARTRRASRAAMSYHHFPSRTGVAGGAHRHPARAPPPARPRCGCSTRRRSAGSGSGPGRTSGPRARLGDGVARRGSTDWTVYRPAERDPGRLRPASTGCGNREIEYCRFRAGDRPVLRRAAAPAPPDDGRPRRCSGDSRSRRSRRARSSSKRPLQPALRVNVKCVTPLGEAVASTS